MPRWTTVSCRRRAHAFWPKTGRPTRGSPSRRAPNPPRARRARPQPRPRPAAPCRRARRRPRRASTTGAGPATTRLRAQGCRPRAARRRAPRRRPPRPFADGPARRQTPRRRAKPGTAPRSREQGNGRHATHPIPASPARGFGPGSPIPTPQRRRARSAGLSQAVPAAGGEPPAALGRLPGPGPAWSRCGALGALCTRSGPHADAGPMAARW